MKQHDPDLRIDAWLHEELDAVPEPTRAVSAALDALAVTPQRRRRLFWLRQLLGLEQATIDHGSIDRPEVVLMPQAGMPGPAIMGRRATISSPVVLAALFVAVTVLATGAWLWVGPGRESMWGGSDSPRPMRPIEQTGPTRSIVVDPDTGHFATLDAAVAAAQPGDRIELLPGTHRAEVVIDKDIEIVGVGARDDIIVKPLSLTQGEASTDRMRVLFTITDAAAVLRGFTLLGSDHGTAVVVEGGAPLLEDLRIDPEGDMTTGGPDQPREAMEVRAGGSPTIRESVLTSLVHVHGTATPVFESVDFQLGCMLIQGEGTRPTIRDTRFTESDCPGFSVSVAGGAHADVVAGVIASSPGNAGIRVANDGSSADITGTGISGGSEGVLVGPGAKVTFQRSNAQGAQIGIKVQDGELVLSAGALVDNVLGLQVSGDSFLEVTDTDFCNETDFDLHDGAEVASDPIARNRVCDRNQTELASAGGS